MGFLTRFILAFGLLANCQSIVAADASPNNSVEARHWPAPYILELTDGALVPNPAEHTLIHLENDGPTPLEELVADSSKWQPHEGEVINLGFAAPTAWTSFTLHNATDSFGTWIVSANRVSQKVFELYVLQNGEISTHIAGARSPEAIQAIEKVGFLSTNIDLRPDEYATVFIRFKGGQASWLPFSVGSEVAYAEEKFTLTLWSLASLIGIGTLILVNFFYFLSTRLYTYFYYCLAEICYVIVALQLQGFTTRFFFYRFPEAGTAFGAIATFLSIMFWLIFAIRFFDTKQHYPKLRKLYYGYNYLCVFLVVTVLAALLWAPGYLPLMALLGALIGTLPWLFLPFHALHASVRYGAAYSFVAPAWFLFSFFLIYSTLSNMLIVPELPLHWLMLGPLGFIEALLISIALANRVRIGQKTLLKTKTALADSLQEKLQTQKREAALAQEKALALQDLAEKGKLVLAASHDTRHMLGAIRQFSSGIHGEQSPERLAAAADQISDLSDMLEHIQSMMIEGAVSGPSTSETLAVEVINAQSLLEGIALIHSSEARSAGTTITIKAHTLRFASDRVMITRILSNLLSNAIKYSQSKRILITARSLNGIIRFQIWDQGCGIPHGQLTRLFDESAPQARLQEATSGTGSGLHISYRLAKQLAGKLNGESTEGKGSVFSLELPMHFTSPEESQVFLLGNEHQWSSLTSTSDFILAPTIEAVRQLKPKDNQLVIFDPAFVSAEDKAILQKTDINLCIATFDRTILSKGEWTNGVQNVIYKPIARECVDALLALRGVQHSSG